MTSPAPARSHRNNTLSLALIQMSCTVEKQPNVDKALRMIAQAAERGAKLICLQELFTNHYPCQSEDHSRFDWAEPIPGPTSEALAAAAKEHGVVIVGSLFEKRFAGVYHNTAVLFERDGSTAGVYRKMHIPDDPLYYEKFYFTPGDLGFPAFNTSVGRVASCVCWDQWFPESARLMALAGAEVLFYPTAIGWLAEDKEQYGVAQHAAWETMIRSHAIANGLFVAAVNRVGTEGGIEFWGASLVVDPAGNIIARGSHDQEEVLVVECNLDQIDVTRTHWPFLRDRRIDAYEGLGKRFLI